jgi:hypothetical protein
MTQKEIDELIESIQKGGKEKDTYVTYKRELRERDIELLQDFYTNIAPRSKVIKNAKIENEPYYVKVEKL